MYLFGAWEDADSTQRRLCKIRFLKIACQFSRTPREGQALETGRLRRKIHTPAGGDATFRQDRPVIAAVKGSCDCTEKHTEPREEGERKRRSLQNSQLLTSGILTRTLQ